jgi:signal transduction histidine kinase
MSDPDRNYLQTSEQWARFLSAFVHELRTPLASIRMLAELLAGSLQGRLAETESRYLENLQEVVREVQDLVGEVAELGRLLAGRAPIRAGEVALANLVEQVEVVVRPQAWERGIALTDSLDPALPRQLCTDPERLRQALTLLLTTAVGQAGSEVFFRLDLGDGELRVVISSDGPPFAEGSLDKLFEPFDGSLRTTRQRPGRLALPLARELARALGGTLRAGNRGGRPTFDLSLPATGP